MTSPVASLIPGHSQDAPGATDLHGWTEHAFMSEVVEQAVREAARRGWAVHAPHRSPTLPTYADKMASLCAQVNEAGAPVVVELHFDIGGGERSGTSARVWPWSTPAAKAGAVLSDRVASALGLTDHGARPQDRAWTPTDTATTGPTGAPLYILRDTEAPAVVLEVYFGDHPTDVEAAHRARRDGSLARAVVDAVGEIVGACNQTTPVQHGGPDGSGVVGLQPTWGGTEGVT